MSARDTLKSVWRGHVTALGCFDASLTQKLFDDLCTSYSEPHRAYHTLDHLIQLFSKLEQHGEDVRDPLRLAFAAWYHDIVYDPRAQDNEERSATRAHHELHLMGGSVDFVERVAQLILATKSHAKGGADADDDLFLDCDYSILGSEPEAYRAYAALVRREYAHLSDAQWRAGRGAFLKGAAAAPRTFRTDLFEGLYGQTARANMATENVGLTSG